MQPEQQITQYLIENPLINAILDDDEDKVNQLINAKESRIEKDIWKIIYLIFFVTLHCSEGVSIPPIEAPFSQRMLK